MPSKNEIPSPDYKSFMAEAEAEQRQDASEVATERVQRKYKNTGNVIFKGGQHAPSGEIYDRTTVGKPDQPKYPEKSR